MIFPSYPYNAHERRYCAFSPSGQHVIAHGSINLCQYCEERILVPVKSPDCFVDPLEDARDIQAFFWLMDRIDKLEAERKGQWALIRVGERARIAAFAVGAPVVYEKDGHLVEEWADGTVWPYVPGQPLGA